VSIREGFWKSPLGLITISVIAILVATGILALVSHVFRHISAGPPSPTASISTLSPTSPPASPTASSLTGITSAPVITAAQASAALLKAPKIAQLFSTGVLNAMSSGLSNDVVLDLTMPANQYIGGCTPTGSIPPPGSSSPAEAGYFNGNTISGNGADIGEQVGAYAHGSGQAALAAAQAVLAGCAFTQVAGTPANIIEFTGSGNRPGEWEIVNDHDVLIEAAINLTGQDAGINAMVDAIEANISQLTR
jgi:hypothetical protein